MAIVLHSTVHLTKGVTPHLEPLLMPETDESEEYVLTTKKMALQAAMALSGLSPENFNGSLNRHYQQGAILLETPRTRSPQPSLSTSSPSVSMVSEITLLESGLSTTSSSRSRRNLGPYFQMLTGSEMTVQSVADENQRASSPTTFDNSFNNRLSNNTDRNNNKKERAIMYQGRDILDLYSNISKPFELVPSTLGTGTKSFFENRSVFSRIAGLELPAHTTNQCSDCNFAEYSYF